MSFLFLRDRNYKSSFVAVSFVNYFLLLILITCAPSLIVIYMFSLCLGLMCLSAFTRVFCY